MAVVNLFSATAAIGSVRINGVLYSVLPSREFLNALRPVGSATNLVSSGFTAGQIANVPAGGIAATDVQTALNELDTEKQPLDATLTALAALVTVADRLIYATGADAFALTTFTAFARTLLDDVDAAASRTTLGLGTMATQAASGVAITGGAVDGTPVGATTPSTGKFTTCEATSYLKSGSTVVASLTAAGTAGAGARHFVTDATQTLTAGIGAVVAGGGANAVPVISDGTNWRIG